MSRRSEKQEILDEQEIIESAKQLVRETGMGQSISDHVVSEETDRLFEFIDSLYDGLATISDLTRHDRAKLLKLELEIVLRKNVGLDTSFLETLRDKFLQYSISLNRKSREEFFDSFRGIPREHEKRHWWSR